MPKERRKRTRVPVGFDINIIVKREHINVKTLNISMTGICCTSDQRLRAAEPCRIILSLNEETTLIMEGNILRTGENEAIIAFQSMDETTFYHLKRLIQYNAGDPELIDQELPKPAFH